MHFLQLQGRTKANGKKGDAERVVVEVLREEWSVRYEADPG